MSLTVIEIQKKNLHWKLKKSYLLLISSFAILENMSQANYKEKGFFITKLIFFQNRSEQFSKQNTKY